MSSSSFVALYLRKSRDKADLADPDLLHKHRREGLRWAKSRGLSVPTEMIFEEIGSGERLRSRPVCRQVLDVIRSRPKGNDGYLWTPEVARLTRGSLPDRAIIYEVLFHARMIHSTRQGDFNLRNPHQLKAWETLAADSAYELGVFKERVEAARIDMILEGRILTGKPPFGWWWNRNHRGPDGKLSPRVEANPAQFPIVQALCREVFTLSTAKLAAKYGLQQAVVYNLLTNPFICGYPARRHYPHGWERVRRDNGEPWRYGSHRVPRDQWLRAEQPGDYEPACTPAEFEAIQRILRERWRGCHTDHADGWCRRLVRFAGHEGHARLSAKNPGKGRKYLTYELSQPAHLGRLYIARQAVHEAAGAYVQAAISQPDYLRAGLALYAEEQARLARLPAGDMALREEVAALERRIDALLDSELDAADRRDLEDLASIRRKREEYKQRLAHARIQLAALARQDEPDAGLDALLLAWPDPVALGARVWDEFSDQERTLIAAGLLAEVRCRVEPVPGRQAWRREVEEVRYRPVVARILHSPNTC